MNIKKYPYFLQIVSILAIAGVFSMVLLDTTHANDSAVIKNTVSSSHSTGGQSSNGADGANGVDGADGASGQDGKNGQNGADGKDGATLSTGEGSSRATVITTINGDTVTEINTTDTEGTGSAEVIYEAEIVDSHSTSSTQKNVLADNLETTTTSDFSLKSAILSLRLILTHYVNLLF